jgi:LemA protein
VAGPKTDIVERRRYNEAVQAYNSIVAVFPNNLFAGLFGFEAA